MVFRKDLWQYIDKSYVLDITRSLIEIPSFKGLLRQETAVAEYLNKIFLENDIHSELIEVENGRCNIIAKLQGDSNGKNLLLNGHLDTVPPYDMVNPFKTQIIGNNLYGRGAVDMKGSVAGMVSAMIAIKKMNLNFSGTITFSGVIDEEEKSLGTIYFIENDLNEYDGAIVGEPTDLKLCIAHRGLRWIEIAIIGKTVHGGSQAEGLNAISLAGEFIPFIEKRMKEYILQSEHEIIGRGSFNIGTIGGGTQPSTVAGNCIIRFDRRWLPTENLQIILNQVESVVKDFSLMNP
jgi:acetylornithine deacetylase/succinyl-diaminopimelate desuccinylase